MPRCKNCPPPPHKGCYYTGKEKTPLGRGWSARFEEEGKRMKGGDGNYYESNGSRWVKVMSETNRNTSPKGALFDRISLKIERGDYNHVDPLYGHMIRYVFGPTEKIILFALERYFIYHPQDYKDEYVDYIMQEDPETAMNIITSARRLGSFGPVIRMVEWLEQHGLADEIGNPEIFDQRLHEANIALSNGVFGA